MWSRSRMRWKRVVLRLAIGTYALLVIFALFNWSSRCLSEMPTVFSDPAFTKFTEGDKCQVNMNELDFVSVDVFETVNISDVEVSNQEVQLGGRWHPLGCSAWQRAAIIVPYRDRWDHLKILLKRLHPMLRLQKLDYQIFVIEQNGDDKFNRGRLLNIGVVEALKHQKFDCFVFHDVDLLPENDKNLFYCDRNARHLASAIDEMRYHVMYYNYAGGVIAISRDHVFRINGYSNDYWGWGKEDDDFSARILEAGLLLSRPPEHIGRYKMVRHHKAWQAEGGYDLFRTWKSRWRDDGLNNVASKYQLLQTKEEKLYTRVLVDLGRPPAKPPVDKDAETVSYLWLLTFFFP